MRGRTWMRTMSAPASAREMAMCAPMPRVPPVTTAVRPSREKRAGREGAIVGRLRDGDGVSVWWFMCGFLWWGDGVFEDGGGLTLTLDPALNGGVAGPEFMATHHGGGRGSGYRWVFLYPFHWEYIM